MTFIEAAADILETEGKPLHAKDIAEKAVARGILSHVGKTPIQTMSAQLSAAVLKGTGPFERVRPGVFSLSKWQGKPPGPGRIEAPRPVEKEAGNANVRSTEKDAAKEGEHRKPPAAVVPNLEKVKAALSEAAPMETGALETASQKRRKRRRKKASKTPVSPTHAAISNASPAHLEAAPLPKDVVDPPVSGAALESEDVGQKQLRDAAPRPRHAEDSLRFQKESAPPPIEKPKVGVPFEIADMLEKILRRASRPMSPETLLEELGIPVHNGILLLEALVVSDALERERNGRRPRFIKHKSGIGLLEREVSGEIITLENQAVELRRRLESLAERQMLRKLRGLSLSTFVRVMIVFLERSGFGAAKPVALKAADGFYLSVQDRRRNGSFRTAVVLRKDAAEHVLSDRAVMDLRGAMHHFEAMGGIIFTTGQVSEKACAEGCVSNLPPVATVDGETLAREMVRLGIGVKERTLSLPTFDDVFFAKLES